MLKLLTRKLIALVLFLLLGVSLGINGYLYQKLIVKTEKSHKAAQASQKNQTNLLASERDWLLSISDQVYESKSPVWKYPANDTLMIFTRNIKSTQKKLAINLTKVSVYGVATNSVVDIRPNIKKIGDNNYIPVELNGVYVYLPDLQQFIEYFIKDSILVRSLKIETGKTFEMVIMIPIEDI